MNNKVVYLIIFLSSCTQNYDSRLHDEYAETLNNFVEKVDFLKKYNFKFYKGIDTYKLEGIGDTIEPSDINLPFFAINRKNDIILTYEFFKDMYFEPVNYVIYDSFSVSTRITKEIEFENVYLRRVSIIRKDYRIEYYYGIRNNIENLESIRFYYPNSTTVQYLNSCTRKCVLNNYNVELSERNIGVLYPDFKAVDYFN